MKHKTNKGINRLFAVVLSALMLAAFTAALVMPQAAYAGTDTDADTVSDKTISGFGTKGIENPESESGVWNKVYFGSKGDVIKFNVLNTNETSFGGNTMLLDCESVLFTSIVYDSYRQYWYHSKVREALNGSDRSKESEDSFITQRFTDAEKAAIISSNKNSPSATDGPGRTGEKYGYAEEYGATSLEFDKTEGSKLFALDAMEMTNASYGFSKDPNRSDTRKKNDTNGDPSAYWLRSPSATSLNKTGIIGTSGVIGSTKVSEEHGVSPALNIDLSKIMFNTKLSDGGFKLTIQDNEMRAKFDYVLRDGTTITVPYTLEGGRRDNINRMSVLMLDKEWGNSDGTWNSDAEIKYYGKLDEDGSFELPKGFDEDWKVYIIPEMVNDGNATDYAGKPVEITTVEDVIHYESSSYSEKYDAKEHGIMVSVSDPSDATIVYGTEAGNYEFSESPKITEVDESPLTVYYKITKDGYHTVTGSETVTIKPVSVTDVSIDNEGTEATLDYSDAGNRDITLTATVSPDLAYNKAITWSSNNESVATVDQNGNVRALKEGEAIITVTTEDGSKTDSFLIRSRHDTSEPTQVGPRDDHDKWISVEYGETIQLYNEAGSDNAPYWRGYSDDYDNYDTNYATLYDLKDIQKTTCLLKNHNPGSKAVNVLVQHLSSNQVGGDSEVTNYYITLEPQKYVVTYKVKDPETDEVTTVGRKYVSSSSSAPSEGVADATKTIGDDTYVLDGWYTDEYCATEADLSNITDYMTVYGKYNNGQKIHYDLNLSDSCLSDLSTEARTAPDDQLGNVGDTVTISEPVKDAMVKRFFDSWNTKPDGTGTTYVPYDPDSTDTTYPNTYTLTENKDLNLYAIWKFTINYDGSDSSITCPSDYEVKGGKNTEIELPGDVASKNGYKFIRWRYAVEVGKYEYYQPGDTFVFSEIFPTLYPELKIIKYKISYDLDGGSLADGLSNKTYYYVNDDTFTINAPVKDGYVFAGWTGTDLDEATKTVTISEGSTGDKEYKANWVQVEWNDPEYVWADDNSSVTATRTEKNDLYDAETETVSTTPETVAATCEENGKTVYTAAFENEVFETQTREVKNEEDPAIGHDYGDVVYKWSDDCTVMTATRTCKNDPSHVEEEISEGLEGHDWGEWTKLDENQHQRVCSHSELHTETADHTWDAGKVTKAATSDADGVKTYTCTVCGATKTEVIPKTGGSTTPAASEDTNQKGSDGTAVGPGASAAAAAKAITTMKSDTDPAGAVFSKLKLKSTKQTSKSITLKWAKQSKAKKYVIYGNKCGKNNKPKKLATVTGSTKVFKKVAGKKLKKGTYYKFIIVALDKNNKVVSTSKLIHVATKGGKVTNHKSVTETKRVISKAKVLKKGKKLKLNAKLVKQSKKLKVKKHVAIRYESSNKKIATVTKKGVVKGKKKGSCYIYAYAQDGVYKKIKVVVK